MPVEDRLLHIDAWEMGSLSKKMWASNVRFITYAESARQREGREVKRKLKKGKQLKSHI